MKHSDPWYWAAREGWYVNLHGKRHFLGKHPGGPKPTKSKKTKRWNPPQEIQDVFHKLMGTKRPVLLNDQAVCNVLDDFLTWCKQNRAAETEDRYRDFIQDFINFNGIGVMGVSDLNAGHVTDWLNSHTGWNNTTKRNAIIAVQRGFNWAVKNRGLPRNPIWGMEKPQAEVRTATVTAKEIETILPIVTPRFRDLLVVSYDCGARPQEVKGLEARHVDLALQRAVLPTKESKGKKRARAIYFPSERSLEVITRLIKQYPNGPLFRNSKGNKWTAFAVKCAFARVDEKVGRRLHQYMFRRTWITRKLVAGVDSHVVAQLSGHSDTSMIDKHYSAIADDPAFMLAQAQKDISSKSDSSKASRRRGKNPARSSPNTPEAGSPKSE